MTRSGLEPSTTSGTIAVVNLHAQIDGLAARAPRTAAESLGVIDLLLLRGHVLGRIADYERAGELAGQLVRTATGDAGPAFLARARASAAFHRFTAALADLDAAERHGLDRATLDAERATTLQALGCHDQAGELYRRGLQARPDVVPRRQSASRPHLVRGQPAPCAGVRPRAWPPRRDRRHPGSPPCRLAG
jgi:tetratricopeptide (TPR) repeat protein